MSAPGERFSAYLGELVAVAEADDRVVGLVGLGSTAARNRVDEWSDHDFWLVVRPGCADGFRSDLSWLPNADRIAVSVIEEHGGGKVIYDDGHVLEFGIGDLDGVASWKANTAEVLYGPPALRAAIAATVSARSDPAGVAPGADREMALVLTQLLIGVGRARRGERLNASGLIRSDALGHLLRAVAERLPAECPGVLLDDLDPTRRIEQAHPDLARRIERLLREDVESCARGLLDLAEALLSPGWDAFPSRGVDAVRRRLGWTD